jgi:PAS domain S-box-containing protein
VFEKHRSSEGRSELPILLKVLPAAASVFAICVGVLVLAGWFFDVELLQRVLRGFVAMNPATAFSFIVAGLALALSIRQNQTEAGRRLATTLSAIVLLISLAKLIGIAANWHPNVDEWLFASKLAAAEREMPNRMAPNTAFNFVLVGLSLLTLDVSTRRFSPSQAFAILTGFSALLPITGYVYGVQSFRGVASFIPMALHTAITFLILAAGIFFARPSAPLAQLFATWEPRGAMARRLFPLAVLLALLLGWLCVWGERHNIFESAFGTALLAITLSVLFVILVTWTVSTVGNLELERAAANRALLESKRQLQEAHDQMELILNHAREIICTIDGNTRVLTVSAACNILLGLSERELIGRSFYELHATADHPKIDAAFRDMQSGIAGGSFRARCRRDNNTFADIIWSLQRSENHQKTYCVGRLRED